MSMQFHEDSVQPWRSVRLDTLVRLRWVAVIGQTTAVLVVYAGLEFDLPISACLAVITLAALLNIALRVRFRMTQQMESDRAAWLLAFDVAELAILLFLTGGMQNPFSFLLISPVLLSATALPPRMTVLLGVFAAACATVLIFYHFPLPWGSLASMRGSSPKNRTSLPTHWRQLNLSLRTSNISHNSTDWLRRLRMNSGRRFPRSP